MIDWTLFEIAITVFLTAGGATLRAVFTKLDRLDKRLTTQETRTAVINERTIEIFHRLERIEEKLDKLLTQAN